MFSFAGSALNISTNSPSILAAARKTFPDAPGAGSSAFHFRLWEDTESAERDPARPSADWPQPYFRGRGHLVIAVYGGGAMLFDLLARRAVGTFTPEMARDEAYWRRVILPVAAGVVSASLGVAPLHCATLVRRGRGLHICGLSGAGKSTLSVALAQRGFALLADDWTYFSGAGGALAACGLPVPVKLLPDARRFFPELQRLSAQPSLNGELAYEVDPGELFGVARNFTCVPERFIFLARRPGAQSRWSRLSPEQVENQFLPALERMPDCLRPAREAQHRLIRALSQLEAWSLVCDGAPRAIAAAIESFCGAPSAKPLVAGALPGHFEIPDLMRRFAPAPFTADLEADGGALRLETDLPGLFARASTLRRSGCSGPPVLCTVLEDGAVPQLRNLAASHRGLSYQVVPGAACYLLDRRARRLIVFAAEAYAQTSVFFRQLLQLAPRWPGPHVHANLQSLDISMTTAGPVEN